MAGWKKVLLEGDAAELSDVAPEDVDFGAAAAGVAATASRQDHKHDVPEAEVGDLAAVDGGAAAIGTADKFVRADHKHALGPLVADLEFAKHEASQMAVQNAAEAPADPVAGQIYFNTGDNHPYIYQP
jgi:hypothetical protein